MNPPLAVMLVAVLLVSTAIRSEAVLPMPTAKPAPGQALSARRLRATVDAFNRTDADTAALAVPNSATFDWLNTNVPLPECPEPAIERTYYFGLWTYREHLRRTPTGFIVTEFLPDTRKRGLSCDEPAGKETRGRLLGEHDLPPGSLRKLSSQPVRFLSCARFYNT